MTDLDYSLIKREDLELRREPRKSKFSVVHKPTGTVAENPVVPGSLTEARFRRPTILPKENRVKDMEGYIEGREEESKDFWVIVTGDNARNEYLDALAKDPEALRISFEGGQASTEGTPAQGQQPTPAQSAAPAAASTASEVPAEQTSPQPSSTNGPPETQAEAALPDPQPVSDDDVSELDDILADLEKLES